MQRKAKQQREQSPIKPSNAWDKLSTVGWRLLPYDNFSSLWSSLVKTLVHLPNSQQLMFKWGYCHFPLQDDEESEVRDLRWSIQWLTTPHPLFLSGTFAECSVQQCPPEGRRRKGLETVNFKWRPEQIQS